MLIFINSIGIFGLFLILSAYFQLQRRKWTDDYFIYNIFNLFGSIFIIVYSLYTKAWINVVLNMVWACVSLYDILINIKKYEKN